MIDSNKDGDGFPDDFSDFDNDEEYDSDDFGSFINLSNETMS
jgi:hypothetical protein